MSLNELLDQNVKPWCKIRAYELKVDTPPEVVGPTGTSGLLASKYIVGPNNKYATIQSAVNDAIAAGGGTVLVIGGNYTENVTINSPTGIAVEAVGMANIVGSVTISGNVTGTTTLTNMAVSPPAGDAVIIEPGCRSLLQNCFITGSTGACVKSTGPTVEPSAILASCLCVDGTHSVNANANGPIVVAHTVLANATVSAIECTNSFVIAFSSAVVTSGGAIAIANGASQILAQQLSNVDFAGANVTALDCKDTSNIRLQDSILTSGTAVCVNIAAAASVELIRVTIGSTAANVISGPVGSSLSYANLVFTSGSAIDPNVTLTPYAVL